MAADKKEKRSLRAVLAVMICKLSRWLLRLLGGGGTSFPGKIALKICPDVLSCLAGGVRVIVVSGTNGKTTTCRLIERGLKRSGLQYFANRSGANLLPGITAEFAANTDFLARPQKEAAVIECDEAALKYVLDQVSPEVLVLTNVFRDQLDRYGEVTHTLENLRIAAAKVPQTVLCLNADDSLIVSLSQSLPNHCVFYGIESGEGKSSGGGISDAMYCIRCKHRYAYSYVTYGHLGGFYCPSCGYRRPASDITVSRILQSDQRCSRVELKLHGRTEERTVPLPAVYNIYNFLASITALDCFGLPLQPDEEEKESVNGFGRMEHFDIGAGVTMILVKNPAGFTQVIEYLDSVDEEFDLMCCLNDQLADGTDISWIWDVPLEKLPGLGNRLNTVYVSGLRREDMFLRLKHARLPQEKLQRVENERRFAAELKERTRPLIIVPTYTAMMKLRPLIAAKTDSKVFWE